MKVLAIVFLAIGCASAFRSGPYLPSGWKPEGPAFYLPSEAQKVQEKQEEVIVLQESEASGSDALREYGPPKVVEISQEINLQALPEVITEQAFYIIETNAQNIQAENNAQDAAVETIVTEEVKENLREAVTNEQDEVVVIEAKFTQNEEQVQVNEDLVVDVTTEIAQDEVATEEQKANLEVISVTTEAEIAAVAEDIAVDLVRSDVQSEQTENVAEVNQEETSNIVSSVQEREETAEKVITIVKEEVRNIEEAITTLEQQIKTEQVQEITQVTEAKTAEENSGSLEQAPEGFLEYGPPGFKEYGPPKEDLVNGNADQEPTPTEQLVETNETRRRRRFSPKFKHQTKGH